MNIKKEKELYKQMDLLQMKEISTYRQQKNGTRIFQLPIKKYGQFIEVGSFQSGYVRRMNGGYTPYQLNKCENYDHFYPEYKHIELPDGSWDSKKTGKYNKYVGKRRITIDNEVDRIEYLIAYCLKNYYINQANEVENGKFISKWKHEYEMKNGSLNRVRELQAVIGEKHQEIINYEKTIRELKEKLDGINGMSVDAYNNGYNDGKQEPEVSVTVNGHKYKVI